MATEESKRNASRAARAAARRFFQSIDLLVGPGTHVHHIDGDPMNNDPENLCALPAGDHLSLHSKGKKRPRTEAVAIRSLLNLFDKVAAMADGYNAMIGYHAHIVPNNHNNTRGAATIRSAWRHGKPQAVDATRNKFHNAVNRFTHRPKPPRQRAPQPERAKEAP